MQLIIKTVIIYLHILVQNMLIYREMVKIAMHYIYIYIYISVTGTKTGSEMK